MYVYIQILLHMNIFYKIIIYIICFMEKEVTTADLAKMLGLSNSQQQQQGGQQNQQQNGQDQTNTSAIGRFLAPVGDCGWIKNVLKYNREMRRHEKK